MEGKLLLLIKFRLTPAFLIKNLLFLDTSKDCLFRDKTIKVWDTSKGGTRHEAENTIQTMGKIFNFYKRLSSLAFSSLAKP